MYLLDPTCEHMILQYGKAVSLSDSPLKSVSSPKRKHEKKASNNNDENEENEDADTTASRCAFGLESIAWVVCIVFCFVTRA